MESSDGILPRFRPQFGIGFQRGTHTRWQLVTHDASGAPTLKAAAVHSAADRTLTLSFLNRSLDEPMTVSVDA